ncbi:unnamed protein product [Parascedosporium putredinis]|uniref:BAR domain-containing protein n=1 Tax=Parascedosporium putredinis TaxID=1442378 RepID=A0A9P1M939_9PEZI|nr:unnamed protein product [Parascedosporium putredinis]CAI7991155.1 unnamed protein product [Parascedosporium putredinis]
MGGEARTSHSDEFKMLETEMALRIDGAERLHRSTTAYVKWAGRRTEVLDDKEKGLPGSYLGRTMMSHGEDFESDSEYGNTLIAVGRTNERIASIQEQYTSDITATWLESLNRSLAMMKDYQLESRRLAYDTSTTKAQRSKREDFRLEEEARSSRAKFDEANEDVLRRMQDIKEAESDSLRELSAFLDAQLDFHERCADELRRAREEIMTATPSAGGYSHSSGPPSPSPSRMASFRAAPARRPPPEVPTRSQTFSRSNSVASGASAAAPPPRLERRVSSHQMVPVGNMRSQLRPIGRINTDVATSPRNGGGSNVFADGYDDETPDSGSPSPGWGPDRCASPATSHSSWGKSTTGSGSGYRKAPPPPPPCRSKKPPPPIPAKREFY